MIVLLVLINLLFLGKFYVFIYWSNISVDNFSSIPLKALLVFMFGFTEKKESPKFVKKLETYEVLETETIRMEVQVTGKPKPHITWLVTVII